MVCVSEQEQDLMEVLQKLELIDLFLSQMLINFIQFGMEDFLAFPDKWKELQLQILLTMMMRLLNLNQYNIQLGFMLLLLIILMRTPEREF